MPTLVLPFQLPCHLRLRSRATARLASPSAALGTPRALRGGREAWRCFSELHGGAPCLPVHRSASTDAAGRIGRGRAAHSACAPRSLSCCCVRVRLRKRCARAKARDVLRAARGKRSALQSPRHRHGTRVPRSGKHLGSRLRGHFTRRGRGRKAEGGRAEPEEEKRVSPACWGVRSRAHRSLNVDASGCRHPPSTSHGGYRAQAAHLDSSVASRREHPRRCRRRPSPRGLDQGPLDGSEQAAEHRSPALRTARRSPPRPSRTRTSQSPRLHSAPAPPHHPHGSPKGGAASV